MIPRVSAFAPRSDAAASLFRGAAPKGPHTATDGSLAHYLQDRLASEDIHLDLSVSIER